MKQQKKKINFKEFLSYHLCLVPFLLSFTLLTPCFSFFSPPLSTGLSASLAPSWCVFLNRPLFLPPLSPLLVHLALLPPRPLPVALPLPALVSLSFSSLLFTLLSASLASSCCLSSTDSCFSFFLRPTVHLALCFPSHFLLPFLYRPLFIFLSLSMNFLPD